MRYLVPVACVAAMIATSAAHAKDGKGFYGSLQVGGASVSDVDVTYYDAEGTFSPNDEIFATRAIPAGSDTLDTQFKLKTAVLFGGALGYDFGLVRADVEVSYARSKLKGVAIEAVNGDPITLAAGDEALFCDYAEIDNCALSGNTVSFDGGPKLRQLNAMANLWVDIPVGSEKVVPYAGGGLGVAGFEVDGEGKARFAWQLGAGLAYHVSPHIALTADIRYRQSSKFSIAYDEVSGVQLGRIKTTSYGLGVRFVF
jgi:opacity protein-like surface antigen